MAGVRKQSETGLYHIVSRGVGGQIIFEDDDDRRHFLVLLKQAAGKYGIRIAAWCLMDNHFHLIAYADMGSLSPAMQWLKSRYAYDANKRYQRAGHLFQSTFASFPIEDESYLAAAVAYIHANPVRAGIANRPLSYPWSSAREYNGELYLVDQSLMPDIDPDKVFADFDKHLLYRGGKMSDEDAANVAKTILGISSPTEVRSLPREKRNEAIASLFASGMRNNQIARITGIPSSTVASARNRDKKLDKRL